MLISFPFLNEATEDTDDGVLHYTFNGSYPVNAHLEWHNGTHIVEPTTDAPVRAIADGKVIHVIKPDAERSTDVEHAQNYGSYDPKEPLWTDKGMVILEHTGEIGHDGSNPVAFTYYSVYMHLKTLDAAVAKDKTVNRKDALGKAGNIYDQRGHMHFEICMDEENLTKLLGHAPSKHPKAEAVPTEDGRTDAVFGSTYVYLPASTSVSDTQPKTNVRTTTDATLEAAMWVQIDYAGGATLVSLDATGTEIGRRTDSDAEYDLYTEANKRHNSLGTPDKAVSSPSGWYELLRFGRNLGRGTNATDKDPLPPQAEHWRKVVTANGEKWVNLNASGTYKFSDADFPSFLGWKCVDDDESETDQRCDSPTIRILIQTNIPRMSDREKAYEKTSEGRQFMASQIKRPEVAAQLRKLICKFPSEFEQGEIEARYGHIKEEDDFKDNPDNWEKLLKHIKALTFTDLPAAYLNAKWHFHPEAFIRVMRRCGWLSKEEIVRTTRAYVKNAKGQNTQELSKFSLLERLEKPTASRPEKLHPALMRTARKYGITTPQRWAYLISQLAAETGRYEFMVEIGDKNYFNKYEPGTEQGDKLGNTKKGDGALFKGRGIVQLTGRSNYVAYGYYKCTSYLDAMTVSHLVDFPWLTTDAGGYYWAAKQKYVIHKDSKGKENLVPSGQCGINYWCDQGIGKDNAKEVTKRINPGLNHFEEVRWPCFEHAFYVLNNAVQAPGNFLPILK